MPACASRALSRHPVKAQFWNVSVPQPSRSTAARDVPPKEQVLNCDTVLKDAGACTAASAAVNVQPVADSPTPFRPTRRNAVAQSSSSDANMTALAVPFSPGRITIPVP